MKFYTECGKPALRFSRAAPSVPRPGSASASRIVLAEDVKLHMEVASPRVDDPVRGRPGKEPSGRPEEARSHSGRACGTERSAGWRDQQDRARETRPPSFDRRTSRQRSRAADEPPFRVAARHRRGALAHRGPECNCQSRAKGVRRVKITTESDSTCCHSEDELSAYPGGEGSAPCQSLTTRCPAPGQCSERGPAPPGAGAAPPPQSVPPASLHATDRGRPGRSARRRGRCRGR